MIRRLALVLALAAAPALAQDAAEGARQAARDLEEASLRMDQAEGASDRVAALTDAVRAYEDGLAAMRTGLRAAAVRETEITRKLRAQEGEVSQLLGALMSNSGRPGPQVMLHPEGPLGSARAGMLVAAVAPGLNARAEDLRAALEEVAALRQLQENAAETLQEGLSEVQAARSALSQAIADRTDLPQRYTEDQIRTAILISSTETLEGFASGLADLAGGEEVATAPEGASIDDRKGDLPLPVSGVVLRAPGEEDAAGVARPGLVIATRPQALVTTPVAATIRYNGPLLDYGLVTILEPQPDLLFVLAGLDRVFGQMGQVLPEGSPVGLMGSGGTGSPTSETTGAGRTETLYIEVREGDTPVDPRTWFATDKG